MLVQLVNTGGDLHTRGGAVWRFKLEYPNLRVPHPMQNASPFPVQSCRPVQPQERGTLFPNSLPARQSEIFPLEIHTLSFCLCNLAHWISSAWFTRRLQSFFFFSSRFLFLNSSCKTYGFYFSESNRTEFWV